MNGEMAKRQTLKFKIEKGVRKFLLQEVIIGETMAIGRIHV
jgi:hypothetical protein